MSALEMKLTSLKQELKSKADNLRHQKRLIERKNINRHFSFNPKKIYRNMKGDKIEVDKIPTKESIEQFWKGIWQDNGILMIHTVRTLLILSTRSIYKYLKNQ